MDIEQKLSVEQLLKPRYKVIADYPASEFLVGDIFTFTINDDYAPIEDEKEVWHDEETGVFMRTVIKYPHLFKKLQWWEERKESELPEYVKYKLNGKVEKLRIFKINWSSYISEYLPATESEYINQNKEHER